ncbi:hypothetical protein AAT19DRAFT_12818 [Rhodotorula toruloides]|uniref:Uncharacterized protein n=1 Tax=Rhodotorula toruloides TaxID=5286 RepID=A0A2T0ACR1_RHOTO|nr:hypothetical protein AAT19DRAFT_12818 [Rhodotorula toruloides]
MHHQLRAHPRSTSSSPFRRGIVRMAGQGQQQRWRIGMCGLTSVVRLTQISLSSQKFLLSSPLILFPFILSCLLLPAASPPTRPAPCPIQLNPRLAPSPSLASHLQTRTFPPPPSLPYPSHTFAHNPKTSSDENKSSYPFSEAQSQTLSPPPLVPFSNRLAPSPRSAGLGNASADYEFRLSEGMCERCEDGGARGFFERRGREGGWEVILGFADLTSKGRARRARVRGVQERALTVASPA